MPKLTPEDLSRLYPTPKAQHEIDEQRQSRRLSRRPKYVPFKLSIWSTLFFISTISSSSIISSVMSNGFASFAYALVGLSLSGIVIAVTLAICIYSYMSITETANEAFGSTSEVLLALVIISLGCLALTSTLRSNTNSVTAILFIAAADATLTFLAIRHIKRRNDMAV